MVWFSCFKCYSNQIECRSNIKNDIIDKYEEPLKDVAVEKIIVFCDDKYPESTQSNLIFSKSDNPLSSVRNLIRKSLSVPNLLKFGTLQ